MTNSNVSQPGLPKSLRSAQDAILLPEVQNMLRKLSEYQLGIFMPHMHDGRSDALRPLPDALTQVESGLEVSFQSAEEIARQTDQFLPVGWFWRAGAATPSAVCKMVRGQAPVDAGHALKHEMLDED